MCAPSTVREALDAVRAGLAFLNQVPAADLPGAVQAGCYGSWPDHTRTLHSHGPPGRAA
jgi:hypothetical protein